MMVEEVTNGFWRTQANATRATETPCALGHFAHRHHDPVSLVFVDGREVEGGAPAWFGLAARCVFAGEIAARKRAPDQAADLLIGHHQRHDFLLKVAPGDGVIDLRGLDPRPTTHAGDAVGLDDLPGLSQLETPT